MNDFLDSLKSDLLDRRFLPVLALLGVALLGALAYAVLGGGSSAPTPRPGPSASAGPAAGAVAITQAPAPNQAVSETTSGAHQSAGTPRNPFAPLPGAKAKSSSASSTPSSGGSSSKGSSGSSGSSGKGSSGSGSSTSGSGGSAPTPAPKSSTPKKPLYYIHFHVTVQFGVVPATPAGAPPQPAQLKTFSDIALDEPFPSKTNAQAVYLGVVLRTGKEAVFALTGEAILHGQATCKPSPAQCQAILLQAGQSERLEVPESSGQTVTYELKVLSITRSISTSASTARAHLSARARAARALLRHAGLSALPGLRYATEKGFVHSGK